MLRLKKTLHASNLPRENWDSKKLSDLSKVKWVGGQALVEPEWTESSSNTLSITTALISHKSESMLKIFLSWASGFNFFLLWKFFDSFYSVSILGLKSIYLHRELYP